jgi:hypothetical protein
MVETVHRGRRADAVGQALIAVGVTGVLLSAAVHLQLWAEGLGSGTAIGPLFVLNAVGGLAIGLGALVWRHWLPVLGMLAFGAATLAAFWLSVTVGLFGFRETTDGVPQLLCEVAEAVAIVCALAVFALRRFASRGDMT